MRKIKIFAFIGMLTVAYLVGGIMGFALCASTQVANAKVENVQDMMSRPSNVDVNTIYHNGRRYTVFESGRSSMFVIKD